MQAVSRQLALLAEPKNPLDSTMSTSSGFFVHTMKHCYATALYTTEAQALSITHARISLPHACNHERTENEPVSRIKMADYSELVTKPLYEKCQIYSGATTILSP